MVPGKDVKGTGGMPPKKGKPALGEPSVRSTALCQALSKTLARADSTATTGPYAAYWPALVQSVQALGGLTPAACMQ